MVLLVQTAVLRRPQLVNPCRFQVAGIPRHQIRVRPIPGEGRAIQAVVLLVASTDLLRPILNVFGWAGRQMVVLINDSRPVACIPECGVDLFRELPLPFAPWFLTAMYQRYLSNQSLTVETPLHL